MIMLEFVINYFSNTFRKILFTSIEKLDIYCAYLNLDAYFAVLVHILRPSHCAYLKYTSSDGSNKIFINLLYLTYFIIMS